MKQYLTIILSLVFLSLLFSCSEEKSEMTFDWIEPSTHTVYIDTCTVNLSTILFVDSVETTAMNNYVGSFHDDVLGEIISKNYMEFNPPNNTNFSHSIYFKPIYRLDSLVLVMNSTKNFHGDTIPPMTFNVHKLLEKIEKTDDNGLFNTTSFDYDEIPMTQYTFLPKPKQGQKFELRLPDELGQEFLDKLVNGDEEMTDMKKFKNYFHGLVLTSNDDANLLYSLSPKDTSTYLRLYYKEVKAVPKDYYLDFAVDTTTQFNEINFNRIGTPFEKLKGKYVELPSSETNNVAFTQGISVVFMKLEFPYLRKLMQLGEYGSVVKAKLTVYPVIGTYSDNGAPLPPSLNLFSSDQDDSTVAAISPNSSYDHGKLNKDEKNQENTCYSFDVTSFIREQVYAMGADKKNLQLVVPDYSNSFQTVVIGNQDHPQAKNVVLELTYSIYNGK